MQLPALQHSGKVIPDSSVIFDYLAATYPDRMKMFIPDDPATCAAVCLVHRNVDRFAQMHILARTSDPSYLPLPLCSAIRSVLWLYDSLSLRTDTEL